MLYYFLVGIGRLLAMLPEGVLNAFCRSLGWALYTLPTSRRRTLLSNLHHAFPDKSKTWCRQMGLEATRRSLEMVVFLLASPYFSVKRLQQQFFIHEELKIILDGFAAAPGPTVVLSPHFSMMEANTLVPLLYGKPLPPMGAVYRPLDLPAFEKWVKETRERWGLRLLSRKDGNFQAVDMLRKGGAVVFLFDQNAGNRGALTLFMDRVCSTSELAGLLAEKCKARVGFIYPERTGFMRSTIRGEYLEGSVKSDDVLFAANLWLENKLRSSENTCADWLWLHSRWRHQDAPRQRFHLKSRRDLLPEQLASLHRTTLPRSTQFFIRLPNWLGDVVMALPLLRALRLSRPDAHLTLLVQPAYVALLEMLAAGDRVIALPPQGAGYGKFFRDLQTEYPDAHILFTNSFRGDYEAWLAGAPQRFGMQRAGQWRPLLTHTWEVPADLDETKIHQTRVWEKYFQYFGLEGELNLSPWQMAVASSNKSGLTIGLICGTENFPDKRWPVAQWRELIQAVLTARSDAEVQLYGTTNDISITTAVAEGLPSSSIRNLAGKTNLVEFAQALQSCDVVVCNDTGGMHLANLLGVPVVAVYGPTNPVRTGPIFESTRVIVQPTNCPPTGGAPLIELSAEKVLAELRPWLARA